MGREKTREGGERRGRTLGQEGWPELNDSELDASHSELGASHSSAELGAKIYGAELGARVAGVELPAMSPTEPRSSAPGTLAPRHVSLAPASMAPR